MSRRSRLSQTTLTSATVAALFVLGLALNLFYGRRGFMPIDQGIVFDGAWRLMSGQVPFRDFVAPNGLVPSAMQVPFFQWLGVTWFAFCLHASIINGCFCALAYGLLRLCEATRIEAAFYGAASAFYFYPPNGTPFIDQHAFFRGPDARGGRRRNARTNTVRRAAVRFRCRSCSRWRSSRNRFPVGSPRWPSPRGSSPTRPAAVDGSA
jgi:hypothetical protein